MTRPLIPCLALILLGTTSVVPATADRRAKVDAAAPHRFRAVAFDYFVLFNPDSVADVAEQVMPGRGREFTNLWRTRQFEYSWLRSVTNRYVDFFAITHDALLYAASALQIALTPDQQLRLLDAYLHMTPWPDTAKALARLRSSGIRVITVANFTPAMLRSNAEHAGLTALFEAFVSTDANHTYKPDPRAYQLGVDALHVPKEDVVFAAFGGWDAVGAKTFGYPTVWVNRTNQPIEQLGVTPDTTVADLNGLLAFVLNDER